LSRNKTKPYNLRSQDIEAIEVIEKEIQEHKYEIDRHLDDISDHKKEIEIIRTGNYKKVEPESKYIVRVNVMGREFDIDLPFDGTIS
jgi:D-ribose pyranose/furanose isomerase RbsD